MKYFFVLILAASACGIPQSEENSDSVEDHFGVYGNRNLERDSGSSEQLGLASYNDWIMDALQHTNMLRGKAKLRALTLDNQLSEGAQHYAEKNACGVKAGFYGQDFIAESVTSVQLLDTSEDKSITAKRTIDNWYRQHTIYDCRSVTQREKEEDKYYYPKVADYMNIMGEDKFTAGYGFATCPTNKHLGLFVVRYGAPAAVTSNLYNQHLAVQRVDFDHLNISVFVPCPQNFQP